MKLRIITPFSIFLPLATLVAADTSGSSYELKPIALPGANGGVALDYFAYDPATGKGWVPASNLGSVVVIDEKTDRSEERRVGQEDTTRSGPIHREPKQYI